jgi:hypothetical protein
VLTAVARIAQACGRTVGYMHRRYICPICSDKIFADKPKKCGPYSALVTAGISRSFVVFVVLTGSRRMAFVLCFLQYWRYFNCAIPSHHWLLLPRAGTAIAAGRMTARRCSRATARRALSNGSM